MSMNKKHEDNNNNNNKENKHIKNTIIWNQTCEHQKITNGGFLANSEVE
jgi:hypothetical protein